MDDQVEPVVIVQADDDTDDVRFTREALGSCQLDHDFHAVSDGVELLDYLNQQGDFSDASAPRPDLILLDLNMPRMSGLEALTEIKSDSSLRVIPIVVFSTSKADTDIALSYALRAASFIEKPVRFTEMVKTMRSLIDFWFGSVSLPVATLSH